MFFDAIVANLDAVAMLFGVVVLTPVALEFVKYLKGE